MEDRNLAVLQAAVAREGYALKLGMELKELAPGRAVVEMTPGGEDRNIFGMVHGGVIFSLMDEAFQASSNSHGTVAVALTVNVAYHRAAEAGTRLRAESREIHRTQKTATYEIRVTDAKRHLLASCQALAYRKKDPLPGLPAISPEPAGERSGAAGHTPRRAKRGP